MLKEFVAFLKAYGVVGLAIAHSHLSTQGRNRCGIHITRGVVA